VTLVGVSLKMYLSAAATRTWLTEVRSVVGRATGAPEMFVLPTFPLLESAARLLGGGDIAWGAQDIAAADDGAQTGEVGGAVLAELGCSYVAVGHAERRAHFGEDDATVAAKAAAAVRHGLTPVVCVGEPDRVGAAAAVRFCRSQLDPVLDACARSPVVVAYEPVWAINAAEPAPPAHIRAVADGVRPLLASRDARLIYGGSAGPGLFAELDRSVDGLFLGRFAHDPAALETVIGQMTVTSQQRGVER